MSPEQSLLSWLVGRNEPAIEFLTAEDVNGFRTPTQRRTLDLASMRTSEQVAQYVALKRIGYDVSIVPGDVLIEDMVCLEPSEDGSDVRHVEPVRHGARSGRPDHRHRRRAGRRPSTT